MMPPGTPAERVAALRAAFDATMADPDFRATAEKTKLEIDPVPGATLQEIVAKVFAAPKPVVARVAKILEGK
jgi:tripartite-type tricarboxylate transporter receptor subunit TctC